MVEDSTTPDLVELVRRRAQAASDRDLDLVLLWNRWLVSNQG